MTRRTHRCPACRGIVVERTGKLLGCRCGWRLVTLEEWQALPPFRQGYALYMQGNWPTSQLADMKNPYAEGTSAWEKFREGEQAAVLAAQDSEE